MPTVLVWSHRAPDGSASAACRIACRTASPSRSIVRTTSAPSTASAGVPVTRAPSAASGSALARVRFQTRTSRPALARLRAIAAPMIPVPSTATDGASEELLSAMTAR